MYFMQGFSGFQFQWRGQLTDYITAIAPLPDASSFVVSSAAGEVAIVTPALEQDTVQMQTLQAATGRSLDCMAISANGRWLAVGGETGTVTLWQLQPSPTVITTLSQPGVWVDRMAWHPRQDQLVFSLGRYAQVWDAASGDVVATVDFAASSVLGLAWHPQGDYLAVCGHQGMQIWRTDDWDLDPQVFKIPSASVAIAWSPDGQFIADGNLDNTLTVIEWVRPDQPWIMQGFPGKVRQLAWSQPHTETGAPLLASCSASDVVIWRLAADPALGWENGLLEGHNGTVQAIAFQPQSFLLASAALDGQVILWADAEQGIQGLNGAPSGFSCLAWNATGTLLAAGGCEGEVILWA